MSRKYARGRKAWGHCARSGRRMLLRDMVRDGYYPSLRVDPAWRDEAHPQERLPAVEDPVVLRDPTGDLDGPEAAIDEQLSVSAPPTFGS